jgi:prepilin-type N-terminal cleavage/methylation domain-containing protein
LKGFVQKLKRFRHRKGFTLFELVIVIVIVLILASIAVPNYIRLKYKANEARAYQDLAFIAYLLEIYKVDWGAYPAVAIGEYFGKNTDGQTLKSVLAFEFTGIGTVAPYVNIKGKKTLTGHDGGIEYFEPGKLIELYNPFDPSCDYHYQSDAIGSNWVLSLTILSGHVLYRTVTQTNLIEAPNIPSP